MQFNLRFLFGVLTCAGVATYALIYATPFWAALSFTLCIGLMLAAIVVAVAAAGKARFFWLGFAIFGWGYWLVLHSPLLAMEPTSQNWRLNPEGAPPLITTRYLVWVYNAILPSVHAVPQLPPTPPPIRAPSLSPSPYSPVPAVVNPQAPTDAFGYAAWRYSYPADPEFMPSAMLRDPVCDDRRFH
jgi:hypothetical protein